MHAPNNLNGLAFLVSLPSTLALASVTGAAYVLPGPERERRSQSLTVVLPVAIHAAFMVVGGRLSAP